MKYCPFCGAALMGGAASFCPECGKALTTTKHSSTSKSPKKRRKNPVNKHESSPPDDGYDGYYNDVKPIDNGHTRDKTSPELVKRIIFVAAGAVIIVVFSVILMYLL